MNKEKKIEYRMYVLALRQLSPINKGVQNCHSCLEYANKYHNDQEYQKYINEYKTLIMLDGGTSQDMIEIQLQLEEAGIKHSYFNEPDLNDCLTAITFLADERVWNREVYFNNYADYETYFNQDNDGEFSLPTYEEWLEHIGGEKNTILIEILSNKRLSQV